MTLLRHKRSRGRWGTIGWMWSCGIICANKHPPGANRSVLSRQEFRSRRPLIRVDIRECICGCSGQPHRGSRLAGARSVLRYRLGVYPRSTLRVRQNTMPLSPRELEIVQFVAEDLTTAEIAERLIISPRTVITHLDRIYTRLGINSRTALVRYAIEAGWLPPKYRTM